MSTAPISDGAATPVRIEHRALRSAIEFAVAIAEAGQRLRPPLAFPVELRPYLKSGRIPAAALGGLRRAIEADEDFRRRLGVGAVPELVDEVGREWLVRGPGWEARVAERLASAAQASADADADARLRRAEKRREAAEQVAVRTRAELVAVQGQLAELRRRVDEADAARLTSATGQEELRRALAEARTAARHAGDRGRADGERRQAVETELATTRTALAEVLAQRDALLAERAERAGAPSALNGAAMGELRGLAERARRVADQLTTIVTPPEPTPRRPLTLPGGAARDSRRATEALLRAGGPVLVDGYNVTKRAWPDDELALQRDRLLDLADDVARRFGSEVVVVFDGAEVVGAHAARRLVRVRYSPPGITADDVIRSEVATVPTSRPVVVVTNDQAVRRDVVAAGGNLITSDAFLDLARR